MRIQLWSYNYDPEPSGIAPVSRVVAQGLRSSGHHVQVVAAHPHYPEPQWGNRVMPYRETRDGIPILRLPLWVGRGSPTQRYRQELTYAMSQLIVTPFLGSPDVLVSVSPCFPALMPALMNVRLRSVPWVIWLQDILPDGAVATGIAADSAVIRASRSLERRAYARADRIAVISRAFEQNLVAKGVPPAKLELIHNPATRAPSHRPERRFDGKLRVLAMGNIGFSQGLAQVVDAIESAPELNMKRVKLVITGTGVAEREVRSRIRDNRVELLGLVDDSTLEDELMKADIALVSQRHEGVEFNLPSKLMTFMGYGLPILAFVDPAAEVAQIVSEAKAGWVVDNAEPDGLGRQLASLTSQACELQRRGDAAYEYAREHFNPDVITRRFENLLVSLVGGR